MQNAERYFDHAATTPVEPRVREAMLPYFGGSFGNANSLHSWGREADAAVERAMEQVARLLEVAPEQIYFTSGATESNNWVLRGAQSMAIGPFEHSAVTEPAVHLLAEGRSVTILDNDGPVILEPESSAALVSVMSVNNETGMRWDVREFAAYAGKLHSDITQSVGKLPVALDEIDFASLSAHKFYGPKGVGALYARDEPPEPLIHGGEQQHGMRGGTLNVPGIVGMGAAAAIAIDEMEANHLHATELRGLLKEGLKGTSDLRWNDSEEQSPYIASFSLLGLEGETLVIELDRAGFGVSAGAACSSRSTEPSHVLTALGLEPEWIRGTLRVSFGKPNTLESTEHLAHSIKQIAEKLRTM